MHYVWNVTGRCNLSCPGCWDPYKGERGASLDVLESVLDRLAVDGCQIVTITGGEPLLHRRLSELIRRLRSAGVREVKVCTNGTLLGSRARELIEAGVTEVHVSMDSVGENAHASLQSADVRADAGAIMGQVQSFKVEAERLGGAVKIVLVAVVDPRELDRFRSLLAFADEGGHSVSYQLLCPFEIWLTEVVERWGSHQRFFNALEGVVRGSTAARMLPNWLYFAAAKRYVLTGSHEPCGAGERFQVISPEGSAHACFKRHSDPVRMSCFDERCLIWTRSQSRGERVSNMIAEARRADS